MRCPECTQRNSVAARACNNCGHKFKSKQLPLPIVGGIGAATVALVAWGVTAAVSPMGGGTSSGNSLTKVAKYVAAGPKSADEALKMRSELDRAVKDYLKQNGSLPTVKLASKLQETLHSSAYEVHAFDLPRGLRVIEVDTGMAASDYLVMQDQKTTNVFPINGLDVFEGGRIVSEAGAPALVLVGHTAGTTAKRPQVKVLALLPGEVNDETEKAVPEVKGEGTASFARNNKDVDIEVSLRSVGTSAGLFAPASNAVAANNDDETMHYRLQWDNGHYKATPVLGKGPLSAVYAIARGMTPPSVNKLFASYLGESGDSFTKQNSVAAANIPPNFSVELLSNNVSTGRKRHRARAATVAYLLSGKSGDYEIDVQQRGDQYVFVGGRKLDADQARLAHIQASGAPGVAPSEVAQTATPSSTEAATTIASAATATTPLSAPNAVPAGEPRKEPAKIVVKEVGKPSSAEDPSKDSKAIVNKLVTAVGQKDAKTLTKIAAAAGVMPLAEKASKALDEAAASSGGTSKGVMTDIAQQVDRAMPKSTSNNRQRNSVAAQQQQAKTQPVKAEATTAVTPTKSKKKEAERESIAKTKGDIMSRIAAKLNNGKDAGADEAVATKTSSPKTSKTSTAETHETVQVGDSESIRMRSGPAISYRSVTEVQKGTKMEVLGKENGWYKVRANGKEGYVYGGLLSCKKSDAYTTATVKQSQSVSDGTKSLATKKAGDKIVVLSGIKDNKYKVQLANGKIGYVPKDSIDVQVDAPPLVP